MGATYEVTLAEPNGATVLEVPKFSELSWTRSVNAVGHFSIEMAASVFDWDLFKVDRRLEIWRVSTSGFRKHIMSGLLQFRRKSGTRFDRSIILRGPDQMDLLDTRIIAAAAGSAGADKSDTVDDVMKAYVRQELRTGAAAARTLSSYISVDADGNLGPSTTKSASRDRLLDVLQDLAVTSWEEGTPVFFDLEPTGNLFTFRTYLNQRGRDRRSFLTLSEGRGTLEEPALEEDYRDEVTHVYAAGQGIEADRLVVEVPDTERAGASVFRRREALFDGRNYSTTASLTAAGRRRLREGRAKRLFTGRVVNTATNDYGLHWDLGDRVRAELDGVEYDVDIPTVSGSVSRGGESIKADLRFID